MKDGRMLGRATIGEAAPAPPLEEQLLESARAFEPGSRVMLLAGEAHSGKSRALIEFAKRCGTAAFIVSLEDEDTGVFPFVYALAQSLGPIARGAQLSFNAMQGRLAGSKSVPHIVAWLRSHIENEAWILVDNVELFADDPLLRELLVGVVNECRSIRWIFAGRTLVPLPIEEWLPYGVAAFPILATSADGDPVTRPLQRLDENELEFLACLSPLRSLEARLVHAIFGEAGTLMARRVRERCPALFEAGTPARLHRDIRRALLERVRNAGSEQFTAAVKRCGEALEACEFYEDLLQLYVRIGAHGELAALLGRRGLALADGVNVDTLAQALHAVPADSPGVRSLQAVLASRRGQFDVAENLFQKALAGARQPLAAQIQYALGCDLLRRNAPGATAIFEQLLDESVPGGPHQSEIRSALAQAYVLAGNSSAALEQIRFALHVLPDVAATLAVVKARAAYVYFYAGTDPMLAERFASDALAQALEQRAYTVAVGAASIMYNIACERDRPKEALAALGVLADCGIKIGNVSFQSYALMAMLEYHVEAGDFEAIARCVQTLASFDVAYESLIASEALVAAEAMQRAWRREFDRAYELLAPSAQRCVGDDYRMLREAELAFYAAAAGWPEAAREHIAQSLEREPRVNALTHKRVRAGLFIGLACGLIGDFAQSAATLNEIREPALQYPRLNAVREAAFLLNGLWQEKTVVRKLREALERLRSRDAGGFALLLAALPSVGGHARNG